MAQDWPFGNQIAGEKNTQGNILSEVVSGLQTEDGNMWVLVHIHREFTCSKSTVETSEQCVKSVQN